MGEAQAEVVHSLAKWKRLTLAEYHIEPGYGIYTDMNAIRADEELGNLHSLYVDQWDWERVITEKDRHIEFLKEIVNRIYAAMVRTEYMVYETYPQIRPCLPDKIHFIADTTAPSAGSFAELPASKRKDDTTGSRWVAIAIELGFVFRAQDQ